MKTRILPVIAAFAVGVLTLLHAAPASAYSSAPLTLCNKSPGMLTVAIGYHTPGVNDPADHSVLTGPFVTQGWWKLQPGACQTFENRFNARYMFWYGFSTQFNNTMFMVIPSSTAEVMSSSWYCVPNYFHPSPGFTFEQENVKDDPTGRNDHCEDATADGPRLWVKFRPVDTWVNPSIEFTGQ
jgi:uncharacterized membrane protein